MSTSKIGQAGCCCGGSEVEPFATPVTVATCGYSNGANCPAFSVTISVGTTAVFTGTVDSSSTVYPHLDPGTTYEVTIAGIGGRVVQPQSFATPTPLTSSDHYTLTFPAADGYACVFGFPFPISDRIVLQSSGQVLAWNGIGTFSYGSAAGGVGLEVDFTAIPQMKIGFAGTTYTYTGTYACSPVEVTFVVASPEPLAGTYVFLESTPVP